MEQEHFTDESLNNPGLHAEVQKQPEQEPVIGVVNRSIFWTVVLVSLLLLGGMTALISRGAIPMAAAIPEPVTVRASSIKTTSFRLYPGISQAYVTSPLSVTPLYQPPPNLL